MERFTLNLRDALGLALPKLALEVAMAGGHSLLLAGPRASGKSLLARRAVDLLPDLDATEQADVAAMDAWGSRRSRQPERPPERWPHHSASLAGLCGGGRPPRPGEVSLAHRGVLCLDELAEFSRACIEGLAFAVEQRAATLYSAEGPVVMPAACMVVGMTATCPCGWRGHPQRACTCSDAAVIRYLARLERLRPCFELAVLVDVDDRHGGQGDDSAEVAARVALARAAQAARGRLNRDVPDTEASAALPVSAAAQGLLDGLGAGERPRVLRVARTLADLAGEAGPIGERWVERAVMLWAWPS